MSNISKHKADKEEEEKMGNFADQIRLTGLTLKQDAVESDQPINQQRDKLKFQELDPLEIREPDTFYGANVPQHPPCIIQDSLEQLEAEKNLTECLSTSNQQASNNLAQHIKQATTIYLDTSYWLLLRDAFLGNVADLHLNTLSQQLIHLTANRAVIFPLSIDTLLAVLKDTDEASIPTTLDLLQSLSQGIALLPFVTRASREVECYLAKQLLPKEEHEAKNAPTPPAFMDFIAWFHEIETNALMASSISSVNCSYQNSLVELFSNPVQRKQRMNILQRFATPAESSEFKTFPKLDAYRQELAQCLQFLQPYIIQQLKRSSWLMIAGTQAQQDMAYRVLMSFLYDHWNQPEQREQFLRSSPSLYVNVLTLAAAYCGDNTDLLPHFIHAQAAIGHCDYYFSRLSVEQALCWLPDQSISHHLMTDFNCHFSCDTSEIIALLQQLYDKQQRCFL